MKKRMQMIFIFMILIAGFAALTSCGSGLVGSDEAEVEGGTGEE